MTFFINRLFNIHILIRLECDVRDLISEVEVRDRVIRQREEKLNMLQTQLTNIETSSV